jgi:WD40 repeat protein
MSVARFRHAATLLLDGKVLITGGDDGSGLGLASAELYDPSTGLFTATTGSMTGARASHMATLLNNAALPNYGKVLISGGDPSGAASAELYDPATGTFAATGSMTVARAGFTATLLNTGKVLVTGGYTDTAELYDPATETFSATGSMTIARFGQTATLLNNAALPNYGKVLIAGGGGVASAELYDPATGTFAATGSMTVARTGHTATRLQDGTVLVVGADEGDKDGNPDLYDPGTGSFTAVGYLWSLFASGHTASLRTDGSVLIAGGRGVVRIAFKNPISHLCSGYDGAGNTLSAATALYAPEAGGFTATGPLDKAREGHTATVLSDGTVLLVGGFQDTVVVDRTRCTTVRTATPLSSAELYR